MVIIHSKIKKLFLFIVFLTVAHYSYGNNVEIQLEDVKENVPNFSENFYIDVVDESKDDVNKKIQEDLLKLEMSQIDQLNDEKLISEKKNLNDNNQKLNIKNKSKHIFSKKDKNSKKKKNAQKKLWKLLEKEYDKLSSKEKEAFLIANWMHWITLFSAQKKDYKAFREKIKNDKKYKKLLKKDKKKETEKLEIKNPSILKNTASKDAPKNNMDLYINHIIINNDKPKIQSFEEKKKVPISLVIDHSKVIKNSKIKIYIQKLNTKDVYLIKSIPLKSNTANVYKMDWEAGSYILYFDHTGLQKKLPMKKGKYLLFVEIEVDKNKYYGRYWGYYNKKYYFEYK